MAPSTPASVAAYAKDEKVLCFHHELLYEAKVLEVRRSDAKDKTSPHEYRVHYKGWKNTWDDWVPQDRIRKLTDDNRELAANLKRELTQIAPPRTSTKPPNSIKKGKGQGSDFDSGRGSEERHSSVPAGARGTKRGKDNDVEKVGSQISLPGVQYSDLSQDFVRVVSADAISPTSRSAYSESSARGTTHDSNYDINPEHSLHIVLDFSHHIPTMPRRRASTRSVRGRRGPNHGQGSASVSAMTPSSLQTQELEEDPDPEAVEDMLSRSSPPPDPPERISKATEKKGLFWAPLLSGTTPEEKDLMDQELIAAGKMSPPPARYHPKYVETRHNDPGNLNRLRFFQDQDPSAHLPIAGIPKSPTNIDPPGSGGPFDALKFPERLVDKLDRLSHDTDDTLRGWDIKALKKIPNSLVSKIAPETLAALPDAFSSTLPPKILATIASNQRLREAVSSLQPSTEIPPTDMLRSRARQELIAENSTFTSPSDKSPIEASTTNDMSTDFPPRKSLRSHARREVPDNDGPSSNSKLRASKPPTRHTRKEPVPENPRETYERLPLSKPVTGRGRGKIATACDRCRLKRVKCDGTRPTCQACSNAIVHCSFQAEDLRDPQEHSGEDHSEQDPPEPDRSNLDSPEQDQSEQDQPDQDQSEQENAPKDLPATTIKVNNSGHGASTIVSGVFASAEDYTSLPRPEADRIALRALHRMATTPQLGLQISSLGRFIYRSNTSHLRLLPGTAIPPKYHPKPVFTPIIGMIKPSRTRQPMENDVLLIADKSPGGSKQQEETFHSRPSVRIVVPDHLKNLLVDDWENVTKSCLVVPMPSKAPVNFIIDTYFDEEKGKRRLGSEEADVFEEFVAGMKVYFDKAIGKTLLYKFERPQWTEIRQLWESGKYTEWNGKGPGDAYGAEHLCRMLVNMPEMVAQTNMDVQSVNRLREEISKLCSWLARNSGRFFCAKYEKPTAEYIEKAR